MTPSEILQLSSKNNLESAALTSQILSRGFDAASSGIKEAADINNKIISSAIDLKKTEIDSWYKRGVLDNADKELDYKYKALQVQQDYHNILMQDRQDQLDEKSKSADQATQNRAFLGLVTGQSLSLQKQFDATNYELRGLESAEANWNTKLLNAKNQNPLASILGGGQDAIDNHLEARKGIEAVHKRAEELKNRQDDIRTNIQSLDNIRSGLINGILDIPSAQKILKGNPAVVKFAKDEKNFNRLNEREPGDDENLESAPDDEVSMDSTSDTPTESKKLLDTREAMNLFNQTEAWDAQNKQNSLPYYSQIIRGPVGKDGQFKGSEFLSPEAQDAFEHARNADIRSYYGNIASRLRHAPNAEAIIKELGDDDKDIKKRDFLKHGGTEEEFLAKKEQFSRELVNIFNEADKIKRSGLIDKAVSDLTIPLQPQAGKNLGKASGLPMPANSNSSIDLSGAIKFDSSGKIKDVVVPLSESGLKAYQGYDPDIEKQRIQINKLGYDVEEQIFGKDKKPKPQVVLNTLKDIPIDYFDIKDTKSNGIAKTELEMETEKNDIIADILKKGKYGRAATIIYDFKQGRAKNFNYLSKEAQPDVTF